MTNKKIDEWYDLAMVMVQLGQAVGAGGGGFLLFLAHDKRKLRRVMEPRGYKSSLSVQFRGD